MTHNSHLFQYSILCEGNSANGIGEGYGSVSGAITPEKEGEYGLELGSGMGMTLGSGSGRVCKNYFLYRYVFIALLIYFEISNRLIIYYSVS